MDLKSYELIDNYKMFKIVLLLQIKKKENLLFLNIISVLLCNTVKLILLYNFF